MIVQEPVIDKTKKQPKSVIQADAEIVSNTLIIKSNVDF